MNVEIKLGGFAALGATLGKVGKPELLSAAKPLNPSSQTPAHNLVAGPCCGSCKGSMLFAFRLRAQLVAPPQGKRGRPKGIRPSSEDEIAMKMIDLVVREQGRERKIVQPAVISWMVKTGKFKRAERSTHRKRITRFFKARQHEALMRNEALARILAGI